MDQGCLINLESLKEGDIVFSILRGNLTVVEINRLSNRSAIKCESIDNQNGNNYFFSKEGYYIEDAAYPDLYSKDPFKYAFDKVREYKVDVYRANQENNQLWTANQQMKKEIEMLRQTKDA